MTPKKPASQECVRYAEEKSAETTAVAEFLPSPTPATLPLRNADDVRLEMAKVYREMRGARLDMADGARLIWVLGQINRVIETSLVEQRVDAMERVLRSRS